ncbi:Glutathione transport system permease protein GsiD [Paenibacillus plantiphilus]|uniref:Glutathione transport system permease protein GsiD n=1 Tax=Paenibacillus plantiphilus TaxID=2905650 RepID=A0ABN8G9H2_9BACL|nr:oligopeptide ABC transporter permease [Paenibacillus plantiphilus]CAH1203678.1 Glutathione transport system permease protein GsiD [Paenibacillus plantiphilus]
MSTTKLTWRQEALSPEGAIEIEQPTSPIESYVRQVTRRFFAHKLAVWGLATTLLLLIVGLLAPWLAPHPPNDVTDVFAAPPSLGHWLGTDQVGRDVLSRLIYGTRVSLIIGFSTVALYVTFGTLIGMLAGYYGRWLDMLLMRITDIFLSFPYMMVVLVIVSILGANMSTIMIVLALFKWPTIAMLVRGSVLSIKGMDYVRAGIALGYSTPRILFRHILPNVMSPIIVNATFGVASTILSEAGLSFLGMGVKSPQASLGNMLHDAQSLTVLTDQQWLWLPAGFIILIAVLAFNFVGDGLRDALDARR